MFTLHDLADYTISDLQAYADGLKDCISIIEFDMGIKIPTYTEFNNQYMRVQEEITKRLNECETGVCV